jgi:hypothetical protein
LTYWFWMFWELRSRQVNRRSVGRRLADARGGGRLSC